MRNTTRRRLVASIGSGLTISVAGCSGISGGTSEDSSNEDSGSVGTVNDSDPAVFSGFTFEGYTLNVSLETTEGYDQIVAFQAGEKFVDTSVTPSAGEVSLDFSDYKPGTYRFAAINSDDDSVVAEVKQKFEPNLELVEWRAASETDAYTPENDVTLASPVLTIENTGNAPDQLNWVGYESETYSPEWVPKGRENETSIPENWSPESQSDYLQKPPKFKSGAEVPVVLQPGERRQLVELASILAGGLNAPYTARADEETAGWSVQQGNEYNVTITIATKYSGLKSRTRTVVWEQIAEMESLQKQPESASIVTRSAEGSTQ